MQCEPITIKQALAWGRKLPYALIRSLSGVTLGPVPEDVDLNELTDARFFGPDMEMRLFRAETELQAVCLTSSVRDITIDRRLALANPAFGKAVTVKDVLDFDEDGQAYVVCTRLTGWEGGT